MSKGDKSLKERLEDGDDDIKQFFPTDNAHMDMVTAMRRSPLRRQMYWGEKSRSSHVASGIPQSEPSPALPPYVVTQTIQLECPDGVTRTWDYRTNKFKVKNDDDTGDDKDPSKDRKVRTSPELYLLRRVFCISNQVLAIDIDETLYWLSATRGSPRHEATLAQIEAEFAMDNDNNHIIMQTMEHNIREGRPMLPEWRRYVPVVRDESGQ